ncbi:ficolin-2-like [Branchiostoma lanceolatum]|uniref:ficolin-2-like n=1 Tax=Branchiostoma lanceolatum TaxID=7740 RepID=UPI003455A02F
MREAGDKLSWIQNATGIKGQGATMETVTNMHPPSRKIQQEITQKETKVGKEPLARPEMISTESTKKRYGQMEDRCERESLFEVEGIPRNQTYTPHLFLSGLKPGTPEGLDCADILQKSKGTAISGVYTIRPRSYGSVRSRPLLVFCRMEGGRGWTVIQRRQDNTVSFVCNWNAYEFGFGHPCGNVWLGNRHIHLLTHQKKYTLQIHMVGAGGEKKFANYDSFLIEGEKENYKLRLGSFSGIGNVKDAMDIHNNCAFSTLDRDNDRSDRRHCAREYKGGWWYSKCVTANLNGAYFDAKTCPNPKTLKTGIFWFEKSYRVQTSGPFFLNACPIKYMEMKIAPVA